MRACVVLVVAGCQNVYGLSIPIASDAAYFDAPLDGPPTCPSDGSPPRFSPNLHQLATIGCSQYTISTIGTAAGRCGTGQQYMQGPLAGPYTPIGALSGPTYYDSPRLAPEGNFALALRKDSMTSAVIATFSISATGDWTAAGDLPLALSPVDDISSPTRLLADGRHLVVFEQADGRVHEWVGDGATWSDAGSYDFMTDLGTSGGFYVSSMRLTADGLHLLFDGEPPGTAGFTILDSVRATTADRFGLGRPLDVPPMLSEAVMTEDCARIYFSGLGSMFFLQQL